MAQEGAYNGVVYDEVCNRYANKRGYDVNGRVIDPLALSKCIPIKTDKKTSETHIVG